MLEVAEVSEFVTASSSELDFYATQYKVMQSRSVVEQTIHLLETQHESTTSRMPRSRSTHSAACSAFSPWSRPTSSTLPSSTPSPPGRPVRRHARRRLHGTQHDRHEVEPAGDHVARNK